MSELIRLRDMQDGYADLVYTVNQHGSEVSPRGMRTKELTDVVVELEDPTKCWVEGVNRGANNLIGWAEAAHLIAGLSNADQMRRVAVNFERFIEQDRLRGAYGPRVHSQWYHVISALKEDSDTRQAGLVIWRPTELASPSADVPCTTTLFFRIRDGKLHMSTHMRSNDVIWGVTYDFPMFCLAQQAVAHALRLPLGTYNHHAISLHAYVDRDEEIIHRVTGATYDGTPLPKPLPARGLTDPHAAFHCLRRGFASLAGHRRGAANYLREIWSPELDTLYEHGHAGGFKLCQTCRYMLPPEAFRNDGDACWGCDHPAR